MKRKRDKELKQREEAVAREVLMAHEVVVSTLVGCGSAPMRDLSFALVVIDEASQATEPAALVPLLLGCQQLLLVGDVGRCGEIWGDMRRYAEM